MISHTLSAPFLQDLQTPDQAFFAQRELNGQRAKRLSLFLDQIWSSVCSQGVLAIPRALIKLTQGNLKQAIYAAAACVVARDFQLDSRKRHLLTPRNNGRIRLPHEAVLKLCGFDLRDIRCDNKPANKAEGSDPPNNETVVQTSKSSKASKSQDVAGLLTVVGSRQRYVEFDPAQIEAAVWRLEQTDPQLPYPVRHQLGLECRVQGGLPDWTQQARSGMLLYMPGLRTAFDGSLESAILAGNLLGMMHARRHLLHAPCQEDALWQPCTNERLAQLTGLGQSALRGARQHLRQQMLLLERQPSPNAPNEFQLYLRGLACHLILKQSPLGSPSFLHLQGEVPGIADQIPILSRQAKASSRIGLLASMPELPADLHVRNLTALERAIFNPEEVRALRVNKDAMVLATDFLEESRHILDRDIAENLLAQRCRRQRGESDPALLATERQRDLSGHIDILERRLARIAGQGLGQAAGVTDAGSPITQPSLAASPISAWGQLRQGQLQVTQISGGEQIFLRLKNEQSNQNRTLHTLDQQASKIGNFDNEINHMDEGRLSKSAEVTHSPCDQIRTLPAADVQAPPITPKMAVENGRKTELSTGTNIYIKTKTTTTTTDISNLNAHAREMVAIEKITAQTPQQRNIWPTHRDASTKEVMNGTKTGCQGDKTLRDDLGCDNDNTQPSMAVYVESKPTHTSAAHLPPPTSPPLHWPRSNDLASVKARSAILKEAQGLDTEIQQQVLDQVAYKLELPGPVNPVAFAIALMRRAKVGEFTFTAYAIEQRRQTHAAHARHLEQLSRRTPAEIMAEQAKRITAVIDKGFAEEEAKKKAQQEHQRRKEGKGPQGLADFLASLPTALRPAAGGAA